MNINEKKRNENNQRKLRGLPSKLPVSQLQNHSNKNIIMSSSKSSRDIQKKEVGPDSCFG